MHFFPNFNSPCEGLVEVIASLQFLRYSVMAKNLDKIDKYLREEAKHVLHDKYLGKAPYYPIFFHYNF